MNIKMVETLTGIPRSNIRFYEMEGLIQPNRLDNGYRDYSEEDVEILKRIKLLRSLHIPLEEIKNLHHGTNNLLKVLDQQIYKIQNDIHELNQSKQLCIKMIEDKVDYSTLHADTYLNFTSDVKEELKEDIATQPIIPYRRFFARILDLNIYTLIWITILVLIFNLNRTNLNIFEEVLDSLVCIVLMFIFEPICLSLFGTTPGKWCLGIHVYNLSNDKLTIKESFNRTFNMFIYGYGCMLPIYSLYREYKSYQSYTNNELLEWEYDSKIVVKEKNLLGYLSYGFSWILVFALTFIFMSISTIPNNKGDLTIQEFAENYNYILENYDNDISCYLDENAEWVHEGNVIHISKFDHPEFIFELDNNIIKKISIQNTVYNNSEIITDFPNELIYLTETMITSQNKYQPFSNDLHHIQKDLIEHIKTGYQKEYLDLSIHYTIDHEGYEFLSDGFIILPDENFNQNHFSFTFEISLK